MSSKHFWLGVGVLVTAGFLAASPSPALAQQAEICNPVLDGSGEPVVDASGSVVIHSSSEPCPAPVAAVVPPVAEVAPAAPPPPTAIEETVHFDFDRSEIRPEFREPLNEVAGQLQQEQPQAEVFLVGHTDAIGDPQYNIGLGERRAESVAEYLAARGVEPARMVLQTRGETQPIATNDTAEGRALNRRVEISTTPPATS